jgi:hypothetical protein
MGHGVSDQQPSSRSQDQSSLPALIIGQTAAWLTAIGAVVYISGTLSLGLKLWYRLDPWLPVLGQLPQNFILLAAFSQVIFPAIIVGTACNFLYVKIKRSDRRTWKWYKVLAAWLLLSALLAGAPVAFLAYIRHNFLNNAIRPAGQIFLLCFILNMVWFGVVYVFSVGNLGSPVSPSKLKPSVSRLLGMAVFIIAVIPAIASVSAVFPLPVVYLCGPSFVQDNNNPEEHYLEGSLIGTSGQWAYVAEYINNGNSVSGRYIAVVPLSAVRLEAIGNDASCTGIRLLLSIAT